MTGSTRGIAWKRASYVPHVVVAAIWLVLVDLGLTILGYVRLQQLLVLAYRRRRVAAGPHGSAMAVARTLRAFNSVAIRYPRSRRCLVYSLTLQRLLARRGVAADVRIGVRRDGDGITGHAWVELDGQCLAERLEQSGRFVALQTAFADPS